MIRLRETVVLSPSIYPFALYCCHGGFFRPRYSLKVLCNAIACWLLLKYIRVNITNSSTVPYKYASYIFKHFFQIFLDIANPHLQKFLLILFSWHHQPATKDKVMCLTVHCQLLLHALAHDSIALLYNTTFHLLIAIISEMFQQCLQERNGMKTCDAIVTKCLWWLTLNGKAHNFVFCNWLVMSSIRKR